MQVPVRAPQLQKIRKLDERMPRFAKSLRLARRRLQFKVHLKKPLGPPLPKSHVFLDRLTACTPGGRRTGSPKAARHKCLRHNLFPAALHSWLLEETRTCRVKTTTALVHGTILLLELLGRLGSKRHFRYLHCTGGRVSGVSRSLTHPNAPRDFKVNSSQALVNPIFRGRHTAAICAADVYSSPQR